MMLHESFGSFSMSFWKPVRHTDGAKDLRIDEISICGLVLIM